MNRLHALDAQLTAPAKPARGLTPPALNGAVHVVRCHAQLRSKDKAIEKYIYLSQLKQSDEHMFYHLCVENMTVCSFIWSMFTTVFNTTFTIGNNPVDLYAHRR